MSSSGRQCARYVQRPGVVALNLPLRAERLDGVSCEAGRGPAPSFSRPCKQDSDGARPGGEAPLRRSGVRASVVVTDLCHQANASSEAETGSAPGTVAPLAMIITLAIPWMVSQVPSTRSASSAARVSCPGAQEKLGRPPIGSSCCSRPRPDERAGVAGGGRFALGVVMSRVAVPKLEPQVPRERMPRSCGAWSHEQETMACPGAVLHVRPLSAG